MPTVRRSLAALSATLLTLAGLLAGAPAALAQTPVDPSNAPPPQPPIPTAAAGSPMWQFLLVAAAAALLTVAVVLTARAVHHPRPHTRRA